MQAELRDVLLWTLRHNDSAARVVLNEPEGATVIAACLGSDSTQSRVVDTVLARVEGGVEGGARVLAAPVDRRESESACAARAPARRARLRPRAR